MQFIQEKQVKGEGCVQTSAFNEPMPQQCGFSGDLLLSGMSFVFRGCQPCSHKSIPIQSRTTLGSRVASCHGAQRCPVVTLPPSVHKDSSRQSDASQTLLCIPFTWGSWATVHSDSVGLGGPKTVSKQLPAAVEAADLWTMF